jgi:D-alanine-D-alanine ligase
VAVIYGGRSPEHDVSRESARCVIDELDRDRYEVVPIAITREGQWLVQDLARLQASEHKALPIDAAGTPVQLAERPGGEALVGERAPPIDVVLPIVHGAACEDGSLQGMLEMAGVAYAGTGVLGSAVCMDKDVAKRLAQAEGIAVADYRVVRAAEWARSRAAIVEHLVSELGLPVFVKPANTGSSVGIARASTREALEAALDQAHAYDAKALVERAVDAREIELAVLSPLDPTAPPEVSVPGEIVAADDGFYNYERKYLDPQGAQLRVPAPLSEAQSTAAQDIARRVFVALECAPMARIDLFLDRGSGALLFNEANTLPGFTPISMYPKLWDASGLPYPALLDRLIALAMRRRAERDALRTAP